MALEIPLPLLRRYGADAGFVTVERKVVWATMAFMVFVGFAVGVLAGMEIEEQRHHVVVPEGKRR
jgi:hypothetical protein